MIAKLTNDHRAMRSLLDGVSDLLAGDVEANMPRLLRDRLAFSRLFHRHIADEAAFIAEMTRHPLADVRAAAADYPGALKALLDDYGGHVRAWNPQAINGPERDRYIASVESLRARLYARLDWEEAAIFPRLIGRVAA